MPPDGLDDRGPGPAEPGGMHAAVLPPPTAHVAGAPAQPSSAEAERAYNVTAYYRQVHREARAAYTGTRLRVGMRAPALRLPTTDGGVADLETLCGAGNVVLVFGCYSAPPCFQELPLIDEMSEGRTGGVQMLFVYTREIHPNEQLAYGTFAHHKSFDDKVAVARSMKQDLGLRMRVAVDDLSGSVHRAYGGLPFCAAVVGRDGVLVHREEWASAEQLTPVLRNLAHGDERRSRGESPRISFSETLWSLERLERKP